MIDSLRSPHPTQNKIQFKTYTSFTSGIFPFFYSEVVVDHVTGPMEGKSAQQVGWGLGGTFLMPLFFHVPIMHLYMSDVHSGHLFYDRST